MAVFRILPWSTIFESLTMISLDKVLSVESGWGPLSFLSLSIHIASRLGRFSFNKFSTTFLLLFSSIPVLVCLTESHGLQAKDSERKTFLHRRKKTVRLTVNLS